jgi:PAS domain-containing protein
VGQRGDEIVPMSGDYRVSGMAVRRGVTDGRRVTFDETPARDLVGLAQSMALVGVERMPDVALFAVDRNLRIVAAAGGALRAAGCPPSSIVGRTLEDVLPLEAYARVVGLYRKAFTGRGQSFDYRSLDGARLYRCETIPVRGASGLPELVVALVRDVTT